MTNLKPIKSGWKWLEKILNDLIDAVNARTVIVPLGGGLDIQETSNGTLIALSGTGAVAKGVGGSGLTQLQIDTLAALVAPPSSPTSGAFYPFTSSGSVQSKGWLGVTVISPAPACAQSTIAVWAANPSGGG